ncbi:autotransporter outer membrane beta-barrel domain-containing protein [Qingshengfaniella alkalisoli]|uniref:Autotransporter outer membrane beta-barrel domain-containing protein n=1 Tax=Qingshengfaniella alkalisoli TaxID=2599296 RepID=A0A5B8IB24_9RHOB|nr:autotransporter outer membrane beta-barrel domain-containing protein [Qingshengfaniella alkalisoli]QDY71319.1 autotransporter outer membrane beta-barrel domain-containing protein [Qingshengfaniella alkalisoli]
MGILSIDSARAFFHGGRLTKYKGTVASIAPALGIVIAVSPTASQAGACLPNATEFVCSGPSAGPGLDPKIEESADSPTFVTESGFANDVDTETSISITATGSGGASFSDAYGAYVKGGVGGLFIRNEEGGSVNVDVTGTFIGQTTDNTSTEHAGIGVYNDAAGQDITITSSGEARGGAHGIYANNNGSGSISVTSTGDAIGTGGSYSYGIRAQGGVTSTTIDIQTEGLSSGGGYGVSAYSLGSGDITITTDGQSVSSDGMAVRARHEGDGNIFITTNAVSTGGSQGVRAEARGDGDIVIKTNADATSSASLSATDASIGIYGYSTGLGSISVTQTGSTTTASGAEFGIYAGNQGGGHISISAEGEVEATDPASGIGIYAQNQDMDGDVSVAVSGAVSGISGVQLTNLGTGDGRVDLSGTATGSGGTALDFLNVSGKSHLVLRDGWMLDGQALAQLGDTDDLLEITGPDDSSIDLSMLGDDMASSGIIGFENFLKSGDVVWTATGTQTGGGFLTGQIAAGELILDDATLLMDAEATPFEVAAGAILRATGESRISGSLHNGGTVTMQDRTPGDRLFVDGDYSAGSALNVDAVLGDDSSASDILDVAGNTSGTTDVFVTNNGGVGALTQQGIPVVLVAGQSDGEFLLGAGDYQDSGENVLVAGAFSYRLMQNDDGGWYLKSAATPLSSPPLPTPTDDTPDNKPDDTPDDKPDDTPDDKPDDRGTPGGSVGGTPPPPEFQPGAPVYEVYPQVLWALNDLPTLYQRVGARHESQFGLGPAELTGSDFADKVWVRLEGEHLDLEPDDSTTLTEFDIDTTKLQFGADFASDENSEVVFVLGVNGYVGQAFADTKSSYGDGSIDATGYGIGITGTWYGDAGGYIDLQGQYSVFDSELKSDVVGSLSSDSDGEGYAVSIEAGKLLSDLNWTGEWDLTPQAQLIYARASFDDFEGPFGETVSTNQTDSLRLRLGTSIDRVRQAENGEDWSHYYGLANLYYEFLDRPGVIVDGIELIGEADRLWGELALGGNYAWDDGRYAIYGEAGFGMGLDNPADQFSVQATLGFRMRW